MPNIKTAPFGANTGDGTSVAQPYMTKPEIAKFLRISVRTLDVWLSRGLLPYRKISRSVRFSLPEVEQAIAENWTINRRAGKGAK
jgi:excisionase family DNA binding protein